MRCLRTHVVVLGSCPTSQSGESEARKKVYFGLGCYGPRSADPQEIGHSDQVSQGSCLHFPHDVAAVHLHRDLADIQLGGDLLIQESSGNEADDLLLAGRQRRKLAPQDGDMLLPPYASLDALRSPAERHQAIPDPDRA